MKIRFISNSILKGEKGSSVDRIKQNSCTVQVFCEICCPSLSRLFFFLFRLSLIPYPKYIAVLDPAHARTAAMCNV